MAGSPDTDSTSDHTRNARALAAGMGILLLLILGLQVASLLRIESLLNNAQAMEALDRMQRLSVAESQVLHQLHIAGSLIGLGSLGLLFRSRADHERQLLAVLWVPIILSTACWGIWALGHIGDITTHHGLGIVIGLIGLVAGLVCPPGAAWLALADRKRPGGWPVPVSLLLCAIVFAWTLATFQRMLPFVAAV